MTTIYDLDYFIFNIVLHVLSHLFILKMLEKQ